MNSGFHARYGALNGASDNKMLFGGDGCGDPPVPIPNTEVKPAGADGTWGADPRESRKPPNALVGAARTPPGPGGSFYDSGKSCPDTW